jgi:hypothetical protein
MARWPGVGSGPVGARGAGDGLRRGRVLPEYARQGGGALCLLRQRAKWPCSVFARRVMRSPEVSGYAYQWMSLSAQVQAGRYRTLAFVVLHSLFGFLSGPVVWSGLPLFVNDHGSLSFEAESPIATPSAPSPHLRASVRSRPLIPGGACAPEAGSHVARRRRVRVAGRLRWAGAPSPRGLRCRWCALGRLRRSSGQRLFRLDLLRAGLAARRLRALSARG